MSAVLARVLALDECEVGVALRDVQARFEHRHRELDEIFECHAADVADRLPAGAALSDERRLLIGATFTSEFAIEGTALCNPSIVAHPDQGGVAPGALRIVMSVRAIGEGHRSSIGFRSGTIGRTGTVRIDRPSSYATTGHVEPALLQAAVLRTEMYKLDPSAENTDFVLNALGEQFSIIDLEVQLARLESHAATRKHRGHTAQLFRELAERTYRTRFHPGTALSERVLWPSMSAERHGIEDARFVRFEDRDAPTYYATYTAYDGEEIRQQLLETSDFTEFTSSPLVGGAAANKGLALFPRKIGGRFAALSRWDRETNAIAFSDNPHVWQEAGAFQAPARSWEILQLGNCGSPIETDDGWLVLTHGVGPMRTYGIGAVLLDLDDPTRVVGQMDEPLLTPDASERDGYVPNVVYSCGALVHAGNLVIPYGISDVAIGAATVALADVLAAVGRHPRPRPTTRSTAMPEKSPQKPAGKKVGKSLKEKRADKRDKKDARAIIPR